jgi:molybdenum cofactor cytidylyltransferase
MTDAIVSTAGVLLAAGRGRRMGCLKQLLPFNDSTVVAASFDALAGHCGAGLVVVLGDHRDEVAQALAGREYTRVEGDSDAQQFDSARRGLGKALELGGVQRVLLHPADHPQVPRSVLDELLGRAADSDRVLLPTYRHRGGHPVLIPVATAADIVSRPATEGGLRAYWTGQPDKVERIEFPDAPELVLDLDTPDDYNAARRRSSAHD